MPRSRRAFSAARAWRAATSKGIPPTRLRTSTSWSVPRAGTSTRSGGSPRSWSCPRNSPTPSGQNPARWSAGEGQRIEEALEHEARGRRRTELEHVISSGDRARREVEGERACLSALDPSAERLGRAQQREVPRPQARRQTSGAERLDAERALRDQGEGQRGPKRLTAGGAVDGDGGVRGHETERRRVSEDGVTRPAAGRAHFFFESTGTSVGAVASGGGADSLGGFFLEEPTSTGTSVGATASGGGFDFDLSISFSSGVRSSTGVRSSPVPGGIGAPPARLVGLSWRARRTDTESSTATICSWKGRGLEASAAGSRGWRPASVEVPEKPLRHSTPPSPRRNMRPVPRTQV